jgi:ABC-type Fe3+ transport system permease subunit
MQDIISLLSEKGMVELTVILVGPTGLIIAFLLAIIVTIKTHKKQNTTTNKKRDKKSPLELLRLSGSVVLLTVMFSIIVYVVLTIILAVLLSTIQW